MKKRLFLILLLLLFFSSGIYAETYSISGNVKGTLDGLFNKTVLDPPVFTTMVHGGWVFKPKGGMAEFSARGYFVEMLPGLKLTASLDLGYFGLMNIYDVKLLNNFSLGFTAGIGYTTPHFVANLCLAYSHLFGKNNGRKTSLDIVSPLISVSCRFDNKMMFGIIYKHHAIGVTIGYGFGEKKVPKIIW